VGISWRVSGDVPLAADYDGDGKADPTVFRPSTGVWDEFRRRTGSDFGVQWGVAFSSAGRGRSGALRAWPSGSSSVRQSHKSQRILPTLLRSLPAQPTPQTPLDSCRDLADN
jgi:hypothetical protein